MVIEKKVERSSGSVIESDVLVIGGGIGGWSSAITAKESGLVNEVAVVEKSHSGRTGPSALVGGVFAAVLDGDDPDGILKSHVEEFDHLLDQEVEERIVGLGPKVVRDLEKWGVKFVKDADGKYLTTYQRGVHSTLRIDGGGIPMMDSLTGYGLRLGVKAINWTMVTDLLAHEGAIVGAVGLNCRTGEFLVFKSKATVLATGGTLFKSRQPGHRNTTGDGWAMAYRAGVELMGFDLSRSNAYGAVLEVGPGNGLMLSQGARLLNNKMEEYAKNYPDFEKLKNPEWHAPLMAMEAKRGNAPPVWLDLRHFTQAQVELIYRSVPYAAKRWEKLGFLRGKQFVSLCEYAPEGPRPCGGLFVKQNFGSRNTKGLFACGEAVSKLQCGSNLNRAAVSGAIAGGSAARWASGVGNTKLDPESVEGLREAAMAPLKRKDGIDPENALLRLQEAIHPYPVSILRREGPLVRALREVERIRDDVLPYLRAYDPHYLRLVHEIRNMVLCAELFLTNALTRKESRYCALREDYPHTDNVNWLKWVLVKKDPKERMNIWTEDVPVEHYRFRPELKKFLHPFWARAKELGYWNLPGEGE